MENKINTLLKQISHRDHWDLKKLHGDASYRIYYRAQCPDKSYIVMQMPDGISSASEEISNKDVKINELPFLNIQRKFIERNIPVPSLIGKSDDEKILILEDLGDELFLNKISELSQEKRVEWYKKAVDLLIEIQRRMKDVDGCIASSRSFNAELLNWEFDHFWEYGVENRLGKKFDESAKHEFIGHTRNISDQLTKLPQVFTHRDFQSRNLIWHNDLLYTIDFQDALQGSFVYDLVALLRDSYVEIPIDFVERIVKHYCNRTGCEFSKTLNSFHLQTIQRKLKDAGRFVYIDKVKGNPNFLKNIPNSLNNVKIALESLEMDNFKNFLMDYIPEWS